MNRNICYRHQQTIFIQMLFIQCQKAFETVLRQGVENMSKQSQTKLNQLPLNTSQSFIIRVTEDVINNYLHNLVM